MTTTEITVCSKCEEERDPEKDFYDSDRWVCKECKLEYSRKRYARIRAARPKKPDPPDLPYKDCSNCEKRKDKSEFYWDNRRDRIDSWCKECRKAAHREYYEANREQALAYARDYRLKAEYGISQKDYEDLYEQQEGKCALCGKEEQTKPLYIDHCHDTGRIRGLLCPPCNSALGALGDSPKAIKQALKYVTTFHEF